MFSLIVQIITGCSIISFLRLLYILHFLKNPINKNPDSFRLNQGFYRSLIERMILGLKKKSLCSPEETATKGKVCEVFPFIKHLEDEAKNACVSKLLLHDPQLSLCILNLHERCFKGLLDNYP